MAKGCTFYFVRHGRTFFNEYMRMQGWSDTPLTRDGIFEVRQSARGLSEVKFSAAYCSDLSRTKETTEIFLEENYHSRKLPITEMAKPPSLKDQSTTVKTLATRSIILKTFSMAARCTT